MSNQLVRIMKQALPHLRYESKSFELAFKKAYLGLLNDAEASGYDLGVTSPEVTDDPFNFLDAVIDELENIDTGEEELIESEKSNVEVDDEWPDEE